MPRGYRHKENCNCNLCLGLAGRFKKGHKLNVGKNHPMYGKHQTKKSNRKRSKSVTLAHKKKNWGFQKGQHFSPKTEFKKGHKDSKEMRIKKSLVRKRKKEKSGYLNSLETREKIRLSKLGEKNPMYCKHSWNYRLTKETDGRVAKIAENLIKYREANPMKPETLRKLFESNRIKPNSKERILDKMIQRVRPNEFKYNGDLSQGIIIGGRIPDFINCNKEKKVIEHFGDYWHNPLLNLKLKWKRTYYETIKHYKEYGFKCLIIWEKELKNPDSVINKVRNF